MATYVYPDQKQLQAVEQELAPRLMKNRPIFELMPIVEKDAFDLEWELLDNFTGLQGVRGLNGQPSRVKAIGMKRYQMAPGVYGEYAAIDEQQLTKRAALGTYDKPVDVTDLVGEKQMQLLQRRYDRIELIGWTLFSTGTFSVTDDTGAILHTDSFTLQTQNAAAVWSNAAASTPLADFRTCQALGAGHGVSFGAKAKAYMRRSVWNEMIANTNAADLYGRRTQGLGTFNNLLSVNQLLMGDDLPEIVVNDESYITDAGAVTRFLPADVVVIIGYRASGTPIAEYRMVRNANNPNSAPGAYTRVIDDPNVIPREVKVHDGHNGGPVIYYGSNIVILAV